LIANIGQGFDSSILDVINLNDMPAKPGSYRSTQLSWLEAKGELCKMFSKLIFLEIAKIAPF
jgi:hypothetical protein